MSLDYIKDGPSIYERSFAIIRSETALERFPADVATVVVRMIHACGMTDLPADVAWSDDVVRVARTALQGGAPFSAMRAWSPTA